MLRFAILTVSDRSARGERADASGPALERVVLSLGWQVVRKEILPDDLGALCQRLAGWADEAVADVILTTGGTGFSPRDVTPEATLAVIVCQLASHTACHALAGCCRDPEANPDRQLAGEPESRRGKHRGHPAGAGSRGATTAGRPGS
jgi:molybdopterin adenylyltransferase